jgi:5-(carboxyamino)imidazole ribonucleotide synthase
MLNCIGSMPLAGRVLSVEGAHLHDYGKTPRAGRKVGHITVCDEPSGAEVLSDKVARLESLVEQSRLEMTDG